MAGIVPRLNPRLLLLVLPFLTIPLSLQAQEARQKITIAGAQSIVPLAERFSAQFRKERPGIEIEIHGGGSNYAVDAARRGEIHIGMIGRNLSNEERADLHVESLGHDAIILLSYPGNPVSSLTLEQIRKIYLGKVRNWQEVGGEKRGVVPLTREKSAAIHAIFTEHLFGRGFNGQIKAFTLRAKQEKILRTIKRIEGSLGYGIVRLEVAEAQGVKVLGVEGKLPTAGNIREEIYPLVRPRLLISRGAAKGITRDWMLGFAQFANQGTLPGVSP